MSDTKKINDFRWHWCERRNYADWVPGPAEDCFYHRTVDKTRKRVPGANTLEGHK